MMRNSIISKTVAIAVSSAVLFAGCGINQNEVLATLDGENITVGVANFMAQSRAAMVEANLLQYYGEAMWSQDMDGSGTTLETQFKDDLLEEIEELYILNKHAADLGVALSDEDEAAITSAAASFVDQNSGKALGRLGAAESTVADYFRLAKIRSLVVNAIKAQADTVVSDEEANQKTFSYIRVPEDYTPSEDEDTDADTEASEDTEAEESTDTSEEGDAEVNEEYAVDVAVGIAVMASGMTLEEIVEGNDDLSVQSGSYGAADLSEDGNSTSFDLSILQALEGYTEGQVSEDPLVVEGDGYYIVRLDSLYDEAATAAKRESVITQRQTDLYDETYEGYREAADWTVNESVWAKVKFDNLYTVVTSKTDAG